MRACFASEIRRFLLFFAGFVVVSASVPVQNARAEEFSREVERDQLLRSVGTFTITNPLGSIRVVGWAQDRVRVWMQKKVQAENAAAAQPILDSIDIAFDENAGGLSLRVVQGKNMSLEDRLKDRKKGGKRVDLLVKAPGHLKLDVWGLDGNFDVSGWNSAVSVRAQKGKITMKEVHASGETLRLVCPGCAMEGEDLRASLSCVGGSEPIHLQKVNASDIYIETEEGAVTLENAEGRAIVVTGSGPIVADGLQGHLEFQSRKAGVKVHDLQGFVSGRTEQGSIEVTAEKWNYDDRAFLETQQGDIKLSLPDSFASSFDFSNEEGPIDILFPNRLMKDVADAPASASTDKTAGAEKKPGSPGLRLKGVLGNLPTARKVDTLKLDRELRLSTLKGAIRVIRGG